MHCCSLKYTLELRVNVPGRRELARAQLNENLISLGSALGRIKQFVERLNCPGDFALRIHISVSITDCQRKTRRGIQRDL